MTGLISWRIEHLPHQVQHAMVKVKAERDRITSYSFNNVRDSVNKTFRMPPMLLGVTEDQAAAVDEEVAGLEEVLVG
jgi:hypothetical protein